MTVINGAPCRTRSGEAFVTSRSREALTCPPGFTALLLCMFYGTVGLNPDLFAADKIYVEALHKKIPKNWTVRIRVLWLQTNTGLPGTQTHTFLPGTDPVNLWPTWLPVPSKLHDSLNFHLDGQGHAPAVVDLLEPIEQFVLTVGGNTFDYLSLSLDNNRPANRFKGYDMNWPRDPLATNPPIFDSRLLEMWREAKNRFNCEVDSFSWDPYFSLRFIDTTVDDFDEDTGRHLRAIGEQLEIMFTREGVAF